VTTNNPAKRLETIDRQLIGLEALRAERERAKERLERELEGLEQEGELLEKVEATLQHIGSKILGQSTKTIDQLLTAGLRLIFEDQNLTFKTKVERFRGRTAVKFELYEGGHTAPLMDAYGGGVLVTAGVLLRVVTIMILGLKRVLILDESLAHLSEQYIPNASKLLQRLCSELDFAILMVSHQAAFAEHADRHYVAKRTEGEGTTFEEKRQPTAKAI